MKSLTKTAAFACVTAGTLVAGLSDADTVVFSGTTYDAVISDPVAVGSGAEGLFSVNLSIVNKTGNPDLNPNTFIGTGDYTGISGDLHHEQYITGPVATQQSSPTEASAASSTVDSHLLIEGNLIITPASEPLVNDGTSSEPGDFAGPDNVTGFGGPLIFDIGTTDDSATSITFAQLVSNGTINLDFRVSNSLGQGEDISASFLVPEPGSLALLGLGGLALLRRRR